MKNLRRAFSLIELLLALSIFSAIALCVYGTFWAGVKLNQRSNGESAVYQQMRLALDLMSSELERALPYDFTNSYPDHTAFEGDGSAVTFLLASGKGLKVVRYYLDSAQEGAVHKIIIGKKYRRNVDTVAVYSRQDVKLRDLVREEWDFREYVSGMTGEDHATEIIATGIVENSLKFAFGYAAGQGNGDPDAGEDDAYQWRDQWTQDHIPSLVRIEMDFLLSGTTSRVIATRKDIFIPHGAWGKPEQT